MALLKKQSSITVGVNTNLGEYHVPLADVPDIDVHSAEENDPRQLALVSKGIGDIYCWRRSVPVNAIHHAMASARDRRLRPMLL